MPRHGPSGPFATWVPMLLFTLATLGPAALLILGALLGGGWIWAALGMITLVTYAIDRLATGAAARHRPDAEFPSGGGLSALLALLHLPMLGLAVWAIGGPSGLGEWDRGALLIGYGLFFGQVSHPNAHELIHRPGRLMRGMGVMVYATLLFGHHVSAHRLIHHVYVGTPADPNSAPKGMGFWHFAPRAWVGSFRAGLRAERGLTARSSGNPTRVNPYFIYVSWAFAALSLSFALASLTGVLTLLALAGYAQVQILLADYVQHYGLRRAILPNGKPAPVGPAQSWNSPHLWSSAMMLNAPRHSDHHLHPGRHYPGLRLEHGMPVLPHALPVMAVIALWPPLWRRVMDARVAAVSGG